MIDRLKKLLRILRTWFKDLFYDSSNNHLDNGRVLAAVSIFLLMRVVSWNMYLKQPINLGEFGTALSAILVALVAYVHYDRKSNADK